MGKSVLILLDTHIVLWVAFDAARLSKGAKTTIEEARQSGEGVAISDITLLELAMLGRKKRIPLGLSLGSFLSEVERRFVVLPMNGTHLRTRLRAPIDVLQRPGGPPDCSHRLVQGHSLVTAIGYGRPRNPSIACRSHNLQAIFAHALGFRILDLPVSPQICLNY